MRPTVRARRFLPLVLVSLLGVAAIAAIVALEQHADESRRAEVVLARAETRIWRLDVAAWNANVDVGGDPTVALRRITSGRRAVERALAGLRHEAPVSALESIRRPLSTNLAVTMRIYAVGSTRGYGRWINGLAAPQNSSQAAVFTLVSRASSEYAAAAERAKTLVLVGSGSVILLLLVAFAGVYRRAITERTLAEDLAAHHRLDAVTDALTGLRNRRALVEELDRAAAAATSDEPLMLAIFDLDGFKQYNDTFGHAAGDALLARLGAALDRTCGDRAGAYRMGGDEFCVLARVGDEEGKALLADATAALSEHGDNWHVSCSAGAAWLPAEASTASEALRAADVRMYAGKRGRASAGRQATDALLRVLSVRDPGLHDHTSRVARHARDTAQRLGLADHELQDIMIAAELHDIGKTAIPDAILSKPEVLDPDEWALVRQHTLLGERIMSGAPALAGAARLVRSSQERVDGTGYPDGLGSGRIPVGSRIIGVCAAFAAMTSDRPYRRAVTVPEALAELRRCAGSQFDHLVVESFCATVEADASGAELAA